MIESGIIKLIGPNASRSGLQAPLYAKRSICFLAVFLTRTTQHGIPGFWTLQPHACDYVLHKVINGVIDEVLFRSVFYFGVGACSDDIVAEDCICFFGRQRSGSFGIHRFETSSSCNSEYIKKNPTKPE